MTREEVLTSSRKEHQNRDLAELDVIRSAGNYAAGAGGIVCCLVLVLAAVLADIRLYCPWVIYFSMLGANWLVRAIRNRKISDGVLSGAFFLLALLALTGFIRQLSEVTV